MYQEPVHANPAKPNVNECLKRFSSIVCAVNYDKEIDNGLVSASIDSVQMGAIDVLRYESHGLHGGYRSFQHLRSDRIDDFILILPLSAPIMIAQSGLKATIDPGSCVFVSTLKPFDAVCGEPPYHDYSEYIVRIPGPLFRQHSPHIDECCGMEIQARQGANKIMKSLVELAVSEAGSLSPAQSIEFGKVLTKVIADSTMESPEVVQKMQMPARQIAHERVVKSAKEYIDCNLSNPQLDARQIATHCRISRSHLHAAFATEETTVGSYIREMRLQYCRMALQNPMLRHQSIIQIAMKWGFNSSSNFCRAYQLRFGKAPGEERKEASFVTGLPQRMLS